MNKLKMCLKFGRKQWSPVLVLLSMVFIDCVYGQRDTICPPQDIILPCRCSQRGSEIQIWCSHSDLPRVLSGLKAVSKSINRPIDELILENNFLPSLPGRSFAPLNIVRLMLRHNGLERLSNGWLNDLDTNLVEIFIVERNLRSIPVDSLNGLKNLEAVTIQSDNLKRLPDFSGLPKLRYVNVQSASLIELSPQSFRDLNNLETIHITGSPRLNRLEGGLFNDLPKISLINLSENGIDWIHLRAFVGLPKLKTLQFSGNKISDAGMVGRAIKDIHNLEVLKLDHNIITKLNEGSFVDLPLMKQLHLNDNSITEIYHGAFHRTPSLKLVHLENNYLRRVHPESFLQSSGSGVEIIHLHNNDIGRIEELRSLLDALPMLRFLDLSYNKLESIPFGALRGHGTLEQLHLNNNKIRMIERDAFMAMPGLRELRLRNNSLSDLLPMPFWNLPGLKGIDLSYNHFRRIEPTLLIGVPSLRRLDISGNALNMLDPTSLMHTPMLETVNISFNEINLIHPATFRNLDKLFEIDAGNNNLQEVVPGLPVAVERINLQRNKIATLPLAPNKAFDLPNLRMLDLSGNALTRIPRSTFKTLPQLRILSLAKNRLQSIDEGSMVGLTRLEILNLQDNRLIALHERSINTLESLRDLNIQGNRLEVLVDHLLDNVPNLERFDVSRNSIVDISPTSFRNCRSLQMLDLSSNNLRELPESLSGLVELKEIDVSYNQITEFSPNVLASWRNLEELKASNNKVPQLLQGSLRNLPQLQYLDLSSNELNVLEHGSIRNLPELQELVLADNKLVELKDRVFEDLPNLQAVHLQQNSLRFISPSSFYHSPSIVYLNLSANSFNNLENVGLRSVRNLEVLDLSGNSIKRIASNPLRGLDWLVELKLDDNKICGIQGEPFTSMPRLRVLSMRNNRMSKVPEQTFKSLRGNIAILDVDGNPLDCSCEMLWYSAWLQETESHFPGPKCRDGSMLRDMRLSRTECQSDARTNSNSNQIPLTNEHGDVFLRKFEYDDCGPENYEDHQSNNNNNHNNNNHNLPPSPEESEYFYDQYVDYPNPLNESYVGANNESTSVNPYSTDSTTRLNQSSNNFVDFNQNKFNQFKNNPIKSNSPFTFFGVPIPSLNIGKMFGGSGRNANTRSATGTRGKGRVQIYRPGDPELSKVFKQNGERTESISLKTPDDQQEKQPETSNDNNLYYRPYFQTPFLEPHVHQGGFTPMIPGSLGGFTPITAPTLNVTNINVTRKWPPEYHEQVPLVTEPTKYLHKNKFEATVKPSHNAPYFLDGISIHDENSKEDERSNENTKRSQITDKPPTTIKPNSYEDEIKAYEDSSYKGASRYEENELTTKLTVEIMTPTAKPIENKPFQFNRHEQNIIKEIVRSPESEFYDSVNHSPSSLSALVAPGATQQQTIPNMYRPPLGKPTIVKVPSPSSSTVTPYASPSRIEEFSSSHKTHSIPKFEHDFESNQFVTQNVIDLAHGSRESGNEIKKREDMDWYFNNYNKSATFDVHDEPGINSYKSSSNNIFISFKSIALVVIMALCRFTRLV